MAFLGDRGLEGRTPVEALRAARQLAALAETLWEGVERARCSHPPRPLTLC